MRFREHDGPPAVALLAACDTGDTLPIQTRPEFVGAEGIAASALPGD
jgi:hypothetical protein